MTRKLTSSRNAFATGVDDVSCTAKSTAPGYQADTWIMAPSGTVPGTTSPCANDSIFKISPSTGFHPARSVFSEWGNCSRIHNASFEWGATAEISA